MRPEPRKALLRLSLMFGTIPVAFIIGYATHSERGFIVAMVVGFALVLVLGRAALR